MKIQLHSDIHIEGRAGFAIPQMRSDVIILAGDIDVGMKGLRWAQHLTRIHDKPVIYIAGNHEFYRHDYHQLLEEMRRYASEYENLFFLEKEEVVINGVRFLGTTLWTNYYHEMGVVQRDKNMTVLNDTLNDHRLIKVGDVRFSAKNAYREHEIAANWLRIKLNEHFKGKTVVVTHHAPSKKCNHPVYGENPLSPGFVSNLEDLVKMADLWCYGHTHASLDINIGKCRLISNQPGYQRERSPTPYDEDLAIEL
ncbi:metallophosphoesterase [Methylophaga thiooxydans]|uniref:metallophosphoesterase n=1 Tax=Methylophaga thiooxydans TaxID=392484 RepID=UPI00235713D9|nr:metallophosphoesterase [Methylophaga thiooxydans]